MTSWEPTPQGVAGHVPAWHRAVDETAIVGHIDDAITEIIGHVGAFDADRVINPGDDATQQRTLGDLALQAAELRAADLWVSGVAPEMRDVVEDLRRELYAKYQRALANLQRHVGGGSAFTTGHFAGSLPYTR